MDNGCVVTFRLGKTLIPSIKELVLERVVIRKILNGAATLQEAPNLFGYKPSFCQGIGAIRFERKTFKEFMTG